MQLDLSAQDLDTILLALQHNACAIQNTTVLIKLQVMKQGLEGGDSGATQPPLVDSTEPPKETHDLAQ